MVYRVSFMQAPRFIRDTVTAVRNVPGNIQNKIDAVKHATSAPELTREAVMRMTDIDDGAVIIDRLTRANALKTALAPLNAPPLPMLDRVDNVFTDTGAAIGGGLTAMGGQINKYRGGKTKVGEYLKDAGRKRILDKDSARTAGAIGMAAVGTPLLAASIKLTDRPEYANMSD
jgi:hypothetical protein